MSLSHLEAKVFGNGTVDAAQRIGIVKLSDFVDLAVFAVAEKSRRILTLAIHTHDRGLALKTAQVIGARCVGQVMLDRNEFGVRQSMPSFSPNSSTFLRLRR